MRMRVDPEKCTGCNSCALICSLTKTQAFNPTEAHIRVITLDYLGFSNPVVCVQCEEPKCVSACPSSSLSKYESGTIQLDATTCIGCGQCVEACIIGAIRLSVERKLPLICDQCGGDPACIPWCPTGCLSLHRGEASPVMEAEDDLAYTVEAAKPFLRKWGIPQSELDWYQKPVSKQRKRRLDCG